MKKYLSVFLIIAGLLSQEAAAQSEAVRSAREEVIATVDKLAEIQEQDLTPEAKEREEIALKKTALQKIINLSAAETLDLKDKLASLTGVETQLISLQDQLLTKLEDYLAYFDDTNRALEIISRREEIQNLAGDFKDWREVSYNQELKKAIDFILVFQNKSLLKTAQERLIKFASEVRKTKLVRESYQPLLNEAARNLREAREANNRALSLLGDYLEKSLAGEVLTKLNSIPQTREPSLRELVETSLTKIKAAYKSLIDLADLARKTTR